MINLIPMAGLGSRYSDAGYRLPKPLVPVSGVPMIVKAIRDMPPADKWIFIVRKEHVEGFCIDKVIRKEVPDAVIIPIEKTTEGQACTCLLGEGHFNPDDSLFIASCDNGYLYDRKKFESIRKDSSIDCAVWTFTRMETLRRNPNAWGWCMLEEDGKTIKDVSVKVPVSGNPFEDHAVVASFYFRKAKDFIDAAGLMIKKNFRIKNEFYVDAIPVFLREMGKRSVIFDVDLYVGWGTPKDLYMYQLAEFLINNNCESAITDNELKSILQHYKKYLKR